MRHRQSSSKNALLRAGVLPIDRLSAIHIDTLACLTRAKPLNSSMLLTMQHDEGGSISGILCSFCPRLIEFPRSMWKNQLG